MISPGAVKVAGLAALPGDLLEALNKSDSGFTRHLGNALSRIDLTSAPTA